LIFLWLSFYPVILQLEEEEEEEEEEVVGVFLTMPLQKSLVICTFLQSVSHQKAYHLCDNTNFHTYQNFTENLLQQMGVIVSDQNMISDVSHHNIRLSQLHILTICCSRLGLFASYQSIIISWS
jgi:hypothetical protein